MGEPADNAECEGLLTKSVSVWREYAIHLRQALLNDLENEEIENPDLCNTRAAQFFEQHSSTYQSLQKVLVAQNKNEEALVVAEEGRTQALYDLLQLCGDADAVDVDAAPLAFADMAELAKSKDITVVVYSMVEADRTLYVWTITPTGELQFNEVNLEESLAEHSTTLSQTVRQLYETMAAAAKGKLCRGPRDNREDAEEEEAAADNQSSDIAELKHLYKVLVEPIKGHLDADKDVIFVPHGMLSLVPFSALQDADGKALISTHAVATAPSARVLQTMLERGNGLQNDQTLVVGNPVTLPQYELQDIPGSTTEAEQIAG